MTAQIPDIAANGYQPCYQNAQKHADAVPTPKKNGNKRKRGPPVPLQPRAAKRISIRVPINDNPTVDVPPPE